MVKSSLACGLQKCIGQSWGNDDFSDFTVVVEGKKYQCHRFILGACSDFFDGLLRSEMRENHESCTELLNMTADIFDVIMNSVYRGIDGLTHENVTTVWKAVHQLQIDHMITECEDFVMSTMSPDKCLNYYDCAKLLQSEKVVKFSLDFLVNNFNHFRDTETFLDLTADELYMMVESHNLNIASEELVIESILRWVSRLSPCSEVLDKDVDAKNDDSLKGENNQIPSEGTVTTGNQQVHDFVTKNFGGDSVTLDVLPNMDMLSIDENVDKDNDRVKDLGRLLSVARVCLLRPDYLQTLKEHPVICTNLEATNVLSNAALYQQSFQHDYWPHSAVHRSCSDMTHVMVFADGLTKQCKFYSLDNGTTHILCPLPIRYHYERTQLTLAVSGQELFLGESFENDVWQWESHIFRWEKSSGWSVSIPSLDTRIEKFLSHCQQLYMITTDTFYFDNDKKSFMKVAGDRFDNDKMHLGNIFSNTISLTFPNRINGAISYKENILLITELKDDDDDDDEDEYKLDDDLVDREPVLQCFNTTAKTLITLDHLVCPPPSTISFRCGDNVYILRDGILSLLISVKNKDDNGQSKDDKVMYQFVAKLWDFSMCPYGAVVYKDELFIFGSQIDNSKTWMTSVPGNKDFKTIKIIQIDSTSKCHPMMVPKSWLRLRRVSYDSVLKNVPKDWARYRNKYSAFYYIGMK